MLESTARTTGKVYIAGAGPGDPKLLTLGAADALRRCDVVVYDALVNPAILSHAPASAERVFAGKRPGRGCISQSEINQLLIGRAREGKTVVRLKGGDPFIFGRGGEEAEALSRAGIEWEVLPGISSGIAAAAYAGIPLTHREHSSSVVFVSGHEDPLKNRAAIDWDSLARSAETVVIFMCARTIAAIAAQLTKAGRPPETPAAVIQSGTYEEQKVFIGVLGDLLCQEDDSHGTVFIESPALAIVGNVVSLARTLQWFGRPGSLCRLRDLRVPAPAETEPAIEVPHVLSISGQQSQCSLRRTAPADRAATRTRKRATNHRVGAR